MRADTHDGPEHKSSIQRPNTLLQLSRSTILELCLATHGRAIHIGTRAKLNVGKAFGFAFVTCSAICEGIINFDAEIPDGVLTGPPGVRYDAGADDLPGLQL
jgi:hypothetical protein